MKEKLKVYHGLPKTPTNENTLFYASFDGTFTPEIHTGSFTKTGGERSFSPNITGYGLNPLNGIKSEITYEIPTYTTTNLPEVSTVDLWAYYPGHIGKLTRFIYAMFCDILVHEDGYLYVGFWRNRVKVRTLEQGYYHFRLVIKTVNKSTGETDVDLYINGRKEGTYKTTVSDVENPPATVSFGHMNDSYVCAVSDVHVTLDDLGDYFPTLPQDFIDGKAIVVPALNQRQSYGDPVLHQVTELLVKSQPMEVLGTIYDLNDVDSDGLERCFNNPELRTANAHTWEATWGKIRITGLDNTFITGVIDTDTAKCRVTSSTGLSDTITISVDNTSGLVVGDRLWVYDYTMTNLWNTDPNYYIEVKAIDSVNKTITVQSNSPHGISVMAGDLLIETTASSSSPVVKTVDGATVNGTWSGLGTQQVTFTLGNNSNIAGKDLIITYCLNAKGDSSPYPKMPSEVIRGYDELGNEMIPVTSVEIEDGFTGKIKGDTSTCFHTIKSYAASSLLAPTSSVGEEVSQDHYNKINNPGDFVTISTSSNNAKVQVRFDFDLFKMLEQKLGEEVSLSWVQNNVAHIKLNAICKGSSHRGAYVEARYYDPKNMEWKLNSGGYSNSTSSFAKISATYSGDLIRNKNTNCFFMVTCSSSDGNSSSFVQIKEVWVNVKLKTGDVYDVLYTKDTNARVSPCNPILVDKQTKEVKRLLPSKTPFSTEVLMYNSQQITQLNNTLITQSNTHMLTTMGTGSSEPNLNNQYRGLIGKLDLTKFTSADYKGEPAYRLPLGSDPVKSAIGCKFVLSQPYLENMNFYQISEVFPDVNQLALKHGIVRSGSELYLRLLVLSIQANSLEHDSVVQFYKLPNRPLIK